jgi:tetratricopeptide (TPR) repeat protein
MNRVMNGARSAWLGGWLGLWVLLWLGACRGGGERQGPGVQGVLEFLREHSARAVYFNAQAHADVVAANPDWLAAGDRQPKSARVRAMAQAVQSPGLFRQLDRQEHFDALVLAGDPTLYRPLSEHLWKTEDWVLGWADGYAVVYRRGAASALTVERMRAVVESSGRMPNERRGRWLAAMADGLVGARRLEWAAEVLEAAQKVDGGSPAVWASRAGYHLARGEWGAAIGAADRALKREGRFRPALSAKAQGLYKMGRFGDAYQISVRLLEDAPEDPVMLFTHANIAHEVSAFQEEIAVLRKLIGIATREGRPVSGYRVYLGQALGRVGKGEEALVELQGALDDPELPPNQRAFASDARERVRTNMRGLPPGQ